MEDAGHSGSTSYSRVNVNLYVDVRRSGPGRDMCRHVRAQVGFMLVDELARQLGASLDKLQHSAALGRGRFCGKRVLLAKPMTFMNNSGESVGKLARYFKASFPALSDLNHLIKLLSGAVGPLGSLCCLKMWCTTPQRSWPMQFLPSRPLPIAL